MTRSAGSPDRSSFLTEYPYGYIIVGPSPVRAEGVRSGKTSFRAGWTALLLACLWLASSSAAWAAEHLTILHTNDNHSHLLPFDSSTDGQNIGGVARRSVFIHKIKAGQPNTLVLDAGDVFQGTPVYTFYH